LKQRSKQPDVWRDFGRYYTGCLVGNHTVQTVLLGMTAAEQYFEQMTSETDLEELSKAMQEYTWQ